MMRRTARPVPIPVAPLPPPPAAHVDPNPVVVDVSPLTDRSSSLPDRSFPDGNAFPGCKEEGVLTAVAGDSITDDEAQIVDGLRNCKDLEVAGGKIADRVEINHLTIREEERMHGTVWRSRESDDLSGCVGTQRAALIPSQRSETSHPLVGIPKRVVGSRFAKIGGSGDALRGTGVGRAANTSERSEVVHCGIRVKKRMSRTVGGLGEAHDLAGGIDGVGRAESSTERSQIDDVVG